MKGIYKKLAKARSVAKSAGVLLMKLEAQFGEDFNDEMGAKVKRAINECRQQGSALWALTAKTAVEAERMHEKAKSKGEIK